MHLVQIISEGDNSEESTVGWTKYPKTNYRSFSVSIAARKKISFTSGDFKR